MLTPAATNSPTMGMILVPCSTTLATRISSTPCAIRSFRLTASATSGGAEVATTCHRFGLLRGSGSIVPGRQTPRDPGSESTHSLSASLHAFSVACAVSGRYSPLAAADVDDENPRRHDAKSRYLRCPLRSAAAQPIVQRRGGEVATQGSTPHLRFDGARQSVARRLTGQSWPSSSSALSRRTCSS